MSGLVGSGSGVPVGTIAAHPANIPGGWLECDGAAISRTDYAALFNEIGTAYGVGDGSTTFNLPDLRGEFVRGFDNGAGVDSGRALASGQSFQIERIVGQGPIGRSSAYTATGPFSFTASLAVFAGGGVNVDRVVFDSADQVNSGDETRPRNVAMYYGIKY